MNDETTSLNTDQAKKANILSGATKQNAHNKQVVNDLEVGAVDTKAIRKEMINLTQFDIIKLKELQDAK